MYKRILLYERSIFIPQDWYDMLLNMFSKEFQTTECLVLRKIFHIDT